MNKIIAHTSFILAVILMSPLLILDIIGRILQMPLFFVNKLIDPSYTWRSS